jgi:hypothetical protein
MAATINTDLESYSWAKTERLRLTRGIRKLSKEERKIIQNSSGGNFFLSPSVMLYLAGPKR